MEIYPETALLPPGEKCEATVVHKQLQVGNVLILPNDCRRLLTAESESPTSSQQSRHQPHLKEELPLSGNQIVLPLSL